MVGSKLSKRGTSGSLNPKTAAALSALPPLGYKAPPTLIDFKTIDPSVIAQRIKNYNTAYKKLSVTSWNTYVSFGIQDFVGPDDYFMHCANETTDASHLRLARYYRKHLESKTKIDGFLMQTISTVETALSHSHPGFFDMSLHDMDLYRANLLLSNDTATSDDQLPMEIEQNIPSSIDSSVPSLASATPSQSTQLSRPLDDKTDPMQISTETLRAPMLPITQEEAPAAIPPPRKQTSNRSKDTSTTKGTSTASKTPTASAIATSTPTTHIHRSPPTSINNIIRIETRWAPQDFQELRSSTKKMHLRLAPILSCFNNDHSWMLEWQTDQMADSPDIAPTDITRFLSIRIATVVKERCFYFSFRINATGGGFSQVTSSKVLATAKRGENLTFDPSSIPATQGTLTYIGDILLKDASVTHRGKYLQYLRKEVLPPDTPAFDIKLRRSNPTGSRITILTVRCGKSESTKTAEILCNALCGDAPHHEIFIARLALGANQTSKSDHERIYEVHNEFLTDVSHLLFSAAASIDDPVTEYFHTGETIVRSPRQWAKSLVFPDGDPMEADLENGGEYNGKAVLVIPSAALSTATRELQDYWNRRNPTLSQAAQLYQDSLSTFPDIPKTVFTKNLDTILSKKFRVRYDSSPNVDDSSSALSPAISSLSGATTTAKSTDSSLKSKIAWRTPLQETLLTKGSRPKPPPSAPSSSELHQLKQAEILEAQQLALNSGSESLGSKDSHPTTKSKASRSSSQSGLTAASAHSRLDKLDTSLKEIKDLLTRLTTTPSESLHHSPPSTSLSTQSPASPIDRSTTDMTGIQLYSAAATSDCTSLALLETPPRKEHPSKRRKQATTPTKSPTSNSNLQNTDTMGSSGRYKC